MNSQGKEIRVDKDVQVMKEFFSLDHIEYADMSPVIIPKGYTSKYIDSEINSDAQVEAIRRSFAAQSAVSDAVLVEGTGHVGVGSIVELSNAKAAALVGADVVLVTNDVRERGRQGARRRAEQGDAGQGGAGPPEDGQGDDGAMGHPAAGRRARPAVSGLELAAGHRAGARRQPAGGREVPRAALRPQRHLPRHDGAAPLPAPRLPAAREAVAPTTLRDPLGEGTRARASSPCTGGAAAPSPASWPTRHGRSGDPTPASVLASARLCLHARGPPRPCRLTPARTARARPAAPRPAALRASLLKERACDPVRCR
eukprot:scaffold10141_cov63-Phaeocystis_antarctica.AAC.9